MKKYLAILLLSLASGSTFVAPVYAQARIKPEDIEQDGRFRTIATTTALATAPASITAGEKVFVPGARGGVFVCVAGDGTLNSVTTFAGPSGVHFAREYTGPIRVEWAGAIADGSTDNTAAISLADTTAETLGTDVLFGRGTYRIATQILKRPNCSWRGISAKQTIIATGSGFTNTQMVALSSRSNTTFTDIEFNNTANTGDNCEGLRVYTNSTNLRVERCRFIDFDRGDGGTTGSAIVLDDATRAIITDCYFEGCREGVRLAAGWTVRLIIRDNIFYSMLNRAIWLQPNDSGSTNIAIESNIIFGTRGNESAIYLSGGGTQTMANVRVIGNSVEGQDLAFSAGGDADLLSLKDMRRFVVSNNTVRNGGDLGIVVERCQHGSVSTNYSERNDSNGISITSSQYVSVTGNTCNNNTQNRAADLQPDVRPYGGIRVDENGDVSTTHVAITGNTCTDSQGTKTQAWGVVILKDDAAHSDIVVSGNALYGNLYGPFNNDSSASDCHVSLHTYPTRGRFMAGNSLTVAGTRYRVQTAGTFWSDSWAATTAVTEGQMLKTSANRVYLVRVAGTTGGSEPTSEALGNITDGSATIYYRGRGIVVHTDVSAISSVAELATTTAAPGDQVSVEGQRGGTFTCVAGDGTPDSVITFAGPSGFHFAREYTGPIRPEWAGAVGDGVTDDTTAFDTTVDLAIASGRRISLTHGAVYDVPSWLAVSVTSKLEIEGNGARIIGPGRTEDFLRCGTSGVRMENVTLEDFKICLYLNGTTVTSVELDRVTTVNCNSLTDDNGTAVILGDLAIHRCVGTGMYIGVRSRSTRTGGSVLVRDCDFSGTLRTDGGESVGVWIGRDGTAFTATFANATEIWTKVAHGLANTATVALSTTGTLPAGYVAGRSYFVINVTADTFQLSATKGGSAVDGTTDGTGTHSVTITADYPTVIAGCKCVDFTNNTSSESKGIITYTRAAKITNNYVSGIANDDWIDAEGIYTKSTHAVVANNTVINSGRKSNGMIVLKGTNRGQGGSLGHSVKCINNTVISTDPAANDWGIACFVDDAEIAGNTIEGLTEGIHISDAAGDTDNVYVHDNTVGPTSKSTGNVHGIYDESGGSGNRVANNRIFNLAATTGGQLIFGVRYRSLSGKGDDCVIDGNKIDSLVNVSGANECMRIDADTACNGLTIINNQMSNAEDGIVGLNPTNFTNLRIISNYADAINDNETQTVSGGTGFVEQLNSWQSIAGAYTPEYGEIYFPNSTGSSQAFTGRELVDAIDTNGLSSANITPDQANDEIDIGATGDYIVTCTASLISDTAATVEYDIAIDGGYDVSRAWTDDVLGAGEHTNISHTQILSLTSGESVSLYANVTADLTFKSIHLTVRKAD